MGRRAVTPATRAKLSRSMRGNTNAGRGGIATGSKKKSAGIASGTGASGRPLSKSETDAVFGMAAAGVSGDLIAKFVRTQTGMKKTNPKTERWKSVASRPVSQRPKASSLARSMARNPKYTRENPRPKRLTHKERLAEARSAGKWSGRKVKS